MASSPLSDLQMPPLVKAAFNIRHILDKTVEPSAEDDSSGFFAFDRVAESIVFLVSKDAATIGFFVLE